MQIDIITIFPSIFDGFMNESMIRIACEKGLSDIRVHDLRKWTTDKHRQVDDIPYGGGSGMVMKPDTFFNAILSIDDSGNLDEIKNSSRIIVFTPRGQKLDQDLAEELSHEKHLYMICGRYEGIDERVHEHIATDEISIGDFILNGGEIPAMAVVEAVVRLIPGVLGSAESLTEESFSDSLLEYPQYTRPPIFQGWSVPDVLLSGHHADIAKWRRKERLRATVARRPDLLDNIELDKEDSRLLDEIKAEKPDKLANQQSREP